MGSVIKRGKKYAIRYDLPGSTRENRKQKFISGFPSSKEAKKALEVIEAKMALDLISNDDLKTIGEVVSTWFDEAVSGELGPRTIIYYRNHINNYVNGHIDHYKLDTLKVGKITSYFKRLKNNGTSDITIFKVRNTLRAAFYYCYSQEYISDKFMDRVKVKAYSPKQLADSENYWTPDEITKASQLLTASSIYFQMQLSLNLALRSEEVAALRVSDLDFKNKIISIRHAMCHILDKSDIDGEYIEIVDLEKKILLVMPKGKKVLKLPMTDKVRVLLLKRLSDINNNKLQTNYNHKYDGFLSVENDGDIITERRISDRWSSTIRRKLKKADMNYITFHGLRHSCASWLAFNGVDIKTIQTILGHADISTTSEIYTHINLDQKLEALNKL